MVSNGKKPNLPSIVIALVGLGFFGLWLSGCATDDERALLQDAQERTSRLDTLYLTARGPGISGDGWESMDTLQVRIGQAQAEEAYERADGRVCINVDVGSGMTKVCLDTESDHEGKLFRIHTDSWSVPGRAASGAPVDSLEVRQSAGCIRGVVIGFYSWLWSDGAVNDQRYKCIVCGEILVCGSNPSC